MDYDAVLAQVLDLLRREQRLSYRVLKLRFQLDDETLGGEHVDTDVDTVHETDLGRAFGYAFMRAFGGEFWFNAMGWFGRYGCHFVISFHPSSHEISPRQVHKILFLQILSLRCR